MAHWDHWYDVVEDDSLRQGDIIRDLVAFWFAADLPMPAGDPQEEYQTPVEWTRGDRVIVTASCDLDARAAEHVLLAPVGRVDPETLRAQEGKEFERRAEILRRGLFPRRFMLSEHPDIDPSFPRSFAAWEGLVLLPVEYVRAHCTGPRLRLKPPYREQFGVWAGARITAVGPEDYTQIPRGPHQPYDKHLLQAIEDLDE